MTMAFCGSKAASWQHRIAAVLRAHIAEAVAECPRLKEGWRTRAREASPLYFSTAAATEISGQCRSLGDDSAASALLDHHVAADCHATISDNISPTIFGLILASSSLCFWRPMVCYPAISLSRHRFPSPDARLMPAATLPTTRHRPSPGRRLALAMPRADFACLLPIRASVSLSDDFTGLRVCRHARFDIRRDVRSDGECLRAHFGAPISAMPPSH